MRRAPDHPFAGGQLDDGRGHLPDRIAASVPRGFRAKLKRAAEREGVTAAAFIRRALEASIAAAQAAGPRA